VKAFRKVSLRRRALLAKVALAACLAAALVLLAGCLLGPDPRYLLLREGMTAAQVRVLLGEPDYYDEPLDGNGGSAWFYCYSRSEIIVEWGPEGRARKTTFLQSMW
jgi:outer membrane protein assembly factor BamE (lipoprotein component of BamABCDE complex)